MIDVLRVLQARAEARALLWQAGEFDYAQAHDALVAWAADHDVPRQLALPIIDAAFAQVIDE